MKTKSKKNNLVINDFSIEFICVYNNFVCSSYDFPTLIYQ